MQFLYEFAERAGVALTVIRKIEQEKGNLQLEKVNHVLLMFGHNWPLFLIKTFIHGQNKRIRYL
jgi:hypothetical protein